MKTIGYVLSSFPVLSETFIGTEMRGMVAQGHRVQPIAFQRPSAPGQRADAALAEKTIYLNEMGMEGETGQWFLPAASSWKGLAFAAKQQGIPFRSLLWNAIKLAKVARMEKCDHLHAHFAQASTATAIVAARLLGIGVSFVGHGYDVYATPSDLPLKLKSVDFAVAVCRDMRHDFYDLVPEARVELVYCGIDTQRFRPISIAGEPGNQLLFIGRLCETKGVQDLLEALALIPEPLRPVVDLVGEGVLRMELEQRVQVLGLSPVVRFLGSRTAEWIAEQGPHYKALIAPFCKASNGDRDTGPVVVKESMAMGLPVLTTHFMGCKEMVADETGMRVAPNAPSELAEAIIKLTSMPMDDLRTMGARGRERVVSLFSADRQARALSTLLESV